MKAKIWKSKKEIVKFKDISEKRKGGTYINYK